MAYSIDNSSRIFVTFATFPTFSITLPETISAFFPAFLKTSFALFNAPEIIKRGDVIIESSEYGHYAGEVQIALNDMVNSGKSNVVGHIREEEVFILDYIKPWQKFSFKEAK